MERDRAMAEGQLEIVLASAENSDTRGFNNTLTAHAHRRLRRAAAAYAVIAAAEQAGRLGRPVEGS